LPAECGLLAAIEAVCAAAPLRHWRTPGGHSMSVTSTNCGGRGWVSDRRGYRYEACDPVSGTPWPAIPRCFVELAMRAAEAGGYGGFLPDACLVNHYVPGARMSLHQDRDERDFSAPIVSVSLGLPAVFLLGGATRSATQLRVPLHHGDVVVWGGPARLRFHGVLPIEPGRHHLVGGRRINLTLRRAG
jgi:alkylated DNA repair protein (DNA oxidative demethylase)